MLDNKKIPYIIFISGGVVSSLGKGIAASIIGGLLKKKSFKIKIRKIDPYLNVDPGTMNPIQHGEVFVTKDGAETDLDLGHYERLACVETNKVDYITAGAVYLKIITKERNGEYLGETIQVIPHLTNEFEDSILKDTDDCDIVICEIGGTVGDIESIPILETARQMKQKYYDKIIFIHIALLPYLKKAQEWKTKPIQHSIRQLLSFGIQPDLLLCRMEKENEENWKQKIAMLCNIKEKHIVAALDADSIYHAMLNYNKEKISEKILDIFQLKEKNNSDLSCLENFVKKIDSNFPNITIAIVGKYLSAKDAYKSLEEALMHAGLFINRNVKIKWIDAEKKMNFDDCDGILVPGGFGQRGIEGKIAAIKYAREKNTPFLGICLGLQLAVIESLSQILPGASSSEFGECENPVIAKLEEWINENSILKLQNQIGGTMRLGEYPCSIEYNSLAYKIYNTDLIKERHRHRYEVNNNYLNYFEKINLKVTGRCNNLVEIIEHLQCDFFVGVQFHPEFQSTFQKPNSLFIAFLQACDNNDKYDSSFNYLK